MNWANFIQFFKNKLIIWYIYMQFYSNHIFFHRSHHYNDSSSCQHFSKILDISWIWFSVNTKGGVSFNMHLWVGFAITPFSKSFKDSKFASFSCLNSIAKNNPIPLIYFMCFPFFPFVSKIFFKLSRNSFPIFAEFSQSLS